MQAIIIAEAGGPANLLFAELPRPEIGPTEVLVKTKALSINPVDVKARASEDILAWIFGPQRPVILGWDLAGEVVAVGAEVQTLQPGDAVFGLVNFFGAGRAYAEYVAVPAHQLARKPAAVSYEVAAATTLAALTAWQALGQHGHVQPGSRVLIHGGAGGVGHFAIQLAKQLGAYVLTTASARNREFVLSLGADEHVDYATERFWERTPDVDFVLDTVGGEVLAHSLAVVRPGGTIITLPTPAIEPELSAQAAAQRVQLAFMMVASSGPGMQALADLLARGAIRPHIAATFPFAAMAEAHAYQETARPVGKVVVTL